MQNIKTFLQAVTSLVVVAFYVYIFLFIFWFLLMLGCTENHSTGECRDNVMTRVVMLPINLIK